MAYTVSQKTCRSIFDYNLLRLSVKRFACRYKQSHNYSYCPILYGFQQIARFRSRNDVSSGTLSPTITIVRNSHFSYHAYIRRPRKGGHRQYFATIFRVEKLEWWGNWKVKNVWGYVYSRFHILNDSDRRTDGRTDRYTAWQLMSAAMCIWFCVARQKVWRKTWLVIAVNASSVRIASVSTVWTFSVVVSRISRSVRSRRWRRREKRRWLPTRRRRQRSSQASRRRDSRASRCTAAGRRRRHGSRYSGWTRRRRPRSRWRWRRSATAGRCRRRRIRATGCRRWRPDPAGQSTSTSRSVPAAASRLPHPLYPPRSLAMSCLMRPSRPWTPSSQGTMNRKTGPTVQASTRWLFVGCRVPRKQDERHLTSS